MITQRSIVSLWVMAQIPTIWEIKGSESAIFGFPWFQPCHLSQNWWGVETWTIKYQMDFSHGRVSKKFFMKIWCRPAEIWDFENHEFGTFQSPISQLAYIRSSWKTFLGLCHDWSQFGILWFMSRLLTNFEKNDMKNDSWNHRNPKMALSLPLISQMVGIWAMTHKDTIHLWVIIVYHSRFGGLPFRGSWDIKGWKS